MLGAGDRRFVLLDFLLIDLPGVPRGSSATRGYGVGVGGGGHGVPTGEKTGNSPQSLGRHRFPPPPPRQVSEGANRRFVNSPPARPRGGCRHRFRSHRCGFPARHLQRISLPPSRWRRLQPGRGTQPPTTHPPTHPRQPGQGQGAGWWWWGGKDTPRCQGRQTRGFCLAQPAPRLPAAMTKRSELALALPSANRPAAPTRGKCPARGVGTDPPMPPSN